MADDSPSAFGANLKRLREAARLTQAALAERCGLHLTAVQRLESGDREPGWPTAITIADRLGVGLEEFRRDMGGPPARAKAGRPPKAKTDPPPADAPKKPRGRPKKSTTQEGQAGGV